ncbi:MAG: epimerase, partial [Phycisphaerae bacterium]
YYGDRGEEWVTEESAAGAGFLADVCRHWEAATQPAREAGVRVVNLRIGVVLSADGGALARMLPAFRFGLGGRIGTGRQYMSWITLDDLAAAVEHLLFASQTSGPVNAVSPNPVTNAGFTKALGRVLRRPTFLSMPAFAVRLALGEMGEAVLLSGVRVRPARLLADGFCFRDCQIEPALRRILRREQPW